MTKKQTKGLWNNFFVMLDTDELSQEQQAYQYAYGVLGEDFPQLDLSLVSCTSGYWEHSLGRTFCFYAGAMTRRRLYFVFHRNRCNVHSCNVYYNRAQTGAKRELFFDALMGKKQFTKEAIKSMSDQLKKWRNHD